MTTKMTDVPLLGAAYNALVENCVFQQDTHTHKEGIRVLKALGERLEIEPINEVRDAFEVLND